MINVKCIDLKQKRDTSAFLVLNQYTKFNVNNNSRKNYWPDVPLITQKQHSRSASKNSLILA